MQTNNLGIKRYGCFIAMLFGFFVLETKAQSSYVAIVSNLNTKEEITLTENQIFYFDLKSDKKVLSGKLTGVSKDSLNFDGKNYSIADINGLSNKKFKRLKNLHNIGKVIEFTGGVGLLTGLLMSFSADDWQPTENSFFAKYAIIFVPFILPAFLFRKLHKGPIFDFGSVHLLETKPRS